jgi:hypothetical protein
LSITTQAGRFCQGRYDPVKLSGIDAKVGLQLRPQWHHDHEVHEADELQRRQRKQNRGPTARHGGCRVIPGCCIVARKS